MVANDKHSHPIVGSLKSQLVHKIEDKLSTVARHSFYRTTDVTAFRVSDRLTGICGITRCGDFPMEVRLWALNGRAELESDEVGVARNLHLFELLLELLHLVVEQLLKLGRLEKLHLAI